MNQIDENMCNIATWNVRGLAGKEHEYIQKLTKENLDILGNTETKKKGNGIRWTFIHL